MGDSTPRRRDAAPPTPDDGGASIDSGADSDPFDAQDADGPTLEVKVVHASLEQARFPVAAGWYEGLPIEGALRFLDQRLGGWLDKERELGHYPRSAGTAIYVESPPGVWPTGAIVLGLGDFGEVTPTRLSDAMAEGTMRYALDVARRHPAEQPIPVGVAAVLAGAPGTYGLGVEASLRAIVGGVARAAARLLDVVSIDRLEIIEYYEGTAEQAASVLKRLADNAKTEPFAVRLEVDGRLEARPGGRSGVAQPGESGAPWPRVELHISEPPSARPERAAAIDANGDGAPQLDDEEGGDEDGEQGREPDEPTPTSTQHSTLVYTALSRRARAQSLKVPVNGPGIRRLVESAVARPRIDARTNHTLYELLFPNQVKLELDELDNLHLLVDETTAWIPWEVLSGRDRDGIPRPLALRTGLLRQLRSDARRASVPMPGPQGLKALVIGDPPAGELFPRLRGARDEAQCVADLLDDSGGYEVTRQIFDRRNTRDRSEEVRNSFFAEPYRIIHIAAHGTFQAGTGDGTAGVVIGKTERLTALEFTRRTFVPDLVFLNCCHLGRIEEYDPDVRNEHGNFADLASSLALELIGSGVKAVVAAGWAVDDGPARTFASTFYSQMLDGHTFGDAVRSARRSAHGEDEGKSNTWGAYQCYGDPGFHFRTTGNTSPSPPHFVSTNQLIQHLDAVRSSAGLTPDVETAQREEEKLDELEELEAERFDDARVLERAGAAYAELGRFDRAVDAYRRACAHHSAEVSMKALEQLANVEARLAALRFREQDDAKQRRIEDSVDDLFKSAKQHLDRAKEHGETPERFAIEGSYFKKLATTETTDESRRRSCIEKALDAYTSALDRVPDRGRLDVYYASLAIQLASLLVDDDGSGGEVQRKYEALLDQLESQLATIDATVGTSYDRARVTDIVATGHIFRRQLADEDVQLAIIDGFTKVIDVRAPFRHRMSVIDHYQDLHELLRGHPSRSDQAAGALAIATKLESYRLSSGLTRGS